MGHCRQQRQKQKKTVQYHSQVNDDGNESVQWGYEPTEYSTEIC